MSLDELRTAPRKLCPLCRQPRKRAAIIRVELRYTHPDGRGAGATIDGKQLSVCETCAEAVWPTIRGQLPL